MMEAVFLAAISSIAGVTARALLEKKKLKLYLYRCIIIGLAAAIFTSFYYDSLFILPLTLDKSFGIVLLFFMAGYVISDLIDTLIFVLKPRRRKR